MAKQGVNKVILIGHIGKQPEYKEFSNGGAQAVASLATGESWIDKNSGEKVEKTHWHRLVFRNRGNYKLAEYACESLDKGTKLYVEGSIENREYEQEGITRYITEIIVSEMQVMSGRLEDSASKTPSTGGNPQYGKASGPNDASQKFAPPKKSGEVGAGQKMIDDDIPF